MKIRTFIGAACAFIAALFVKKKPGMITIPTPDVPVGSDEFIYGSAVTPKFKLITKKYEVVFKNCWFEPIRH